MHPTAMENCKEFFACYGPSIRSETPIRVLDVGSQDENGTLRTACPPSFEYVGIDCVAGKGVDIVLEDPYVLPLPAASADVVLSSSCFEHSGMFWVLFLEILRVLKPNGLFYLNVPSNGDFHRWPVDCWRFYPDSGRALVTWAKRNAFNAALLESYTGTQIGDQWNDFVAVFLKDGRMASQFTNRIVSTKAAFTNGLVLNSDEFLKYSAVPEDRRKMLAISQILSNQIKVV